MAMDSSECNGSGEPTKVELEGGEVGSDKDLTKSDSIASPERQDNDSEGIGGPFVFVNGDSDDPSDKDLDLHQKSDLATTGEDKDPSEINAGEKQGVVESENACDPAEGGNAGAESGEKVEESTYTRELSEDTTDNGELGGKVEKESTDNGELSEDTTDNGELVEKVEKESTDNGELSEDTTDNGELVEKVEKESRDNGELSEDTTDNGELVEKMEQESTDNGELSENTTNNVELGEKVEKESTDNGELSENTTNNVELGEKVEKESTDNGELSENTTSNVELGGKVEKESTDNGELSEIAANNNGELREEVEQKSTENGELSESATNNNGDLGEKVEEESRDNGQVSENIANNNGELREKVEEEVTDNGQVSENRKNNSGELGEGEKEEEIKMDEKMGGNKGELRDKEEVESSVVVVEEEEIIVEESMVEEEEEEEESEGVQLSESVVDTAEKEAAMPLIIGQENGHHKEEEEEEEEETTPEEQKEEPQELDSTSNVLEPENPEVEEAPETELKVVDYSDVEPEQTKNNNMQEEEEPPLPLEEPAEETPEMKSRELEMTPEDKPQESQSVKESDDTPTLLTDEPPSPITQDSPPPLETKTTDESGEIVEENESAAPRDIDLSETKTHLVDESVQIGNFTICIGENGPATLHDEEAPEVVAVSNGAPEEAASTSTTTTIEGAEKAQQQVLTLLPKRVFMIKVPRYSNEEQWARIQEAQAHLDDLTRQRDAIRQLIHNKRAVSKDAWDEVQKAREEERAARAVFNAKRHEISSVQSVINKLNKANSIDDMDDLIDAKEKSLQHETMSLKQEKMLIQEIKDLKSKRKQLVDNMGSAAEIDEAFNQRDSVYDKLKGLKTELEVLGNALAKAEGKTKEAQKNYDDTERSLCDSQDAHKAAHDVREKAYFHWRHLKNQLAAKNKHFFSYLDERKQANKYVAPALDLEGLHSFCNNQVERVMELWNNDEEFRKQYVESNKMSTIRRLRTLDGRALAPDEDPPVLPSTSSTSSSYKLRSNTPAPPTTNQIILEKTSHVEKLRDQFPALPQIKAKAPSPPPPTTNKKSSKDAVTVAEEERKRAEEDEKERKKREDEMERKNREEEIRSKAKAEAQEKERLREVQKAKAKEAEERKKRKAEKAQERAEFKARKEAEIRDKKRAKKDKKKGEADSDDNGGGESATVEMARETTSSPPVAAAATKRPARPAAMKQLKRVEPVPVALRNRNRKKMRTWIIGIATAVAAVLTVFLIGNYLNWSDISSLFYV